MEKLSDIFQNDYIVRDGSFLQTQFADTSMPDSLCLVTSEVYLKQALANNNVTCIITSPKYAGGVSHQGLVVSDMPERLFFETHNRLYNDNKMRILMDFGIDKTTRIHPTANVAEEVWIGKNVIISANAIIEPYSYIDDDVFIGPGAIIGACGHFYKRFEGKLFNVQHAGGVRLERGAQVLAGAIVSKALHTSCTTIGEETVVSVQSHIGHGCIIGKRCIIAGNAQIAGFSKIGNDVWIGPSVTIGNLRSIGDGARIEVGSVVVKDVLSGEQVSGNFAVPHSRNLRDFARRVKRD